MEENGPQQMLWPIFVMHCVGLPLSGSPLIFPHPQSFVEQERTAHIPTERGGAGTARFCAALLVEGTGNWGHIPPESGGALFRWKYAVGSKSKW